ncbi:MAG: LiaI-LiaF-like domain-containing protein [Terriglobales bacterium]
MSDTTSQLPVRRCQCGRGLFGPLVLIALGVIFLLDQMHIMSAGYAFNYFWPALLIIFGIELLSWRPAGPRAFWGVIAILVGAGMIASNLGYWYFDIGHWWPLILIAFGIALLFRRATGIGWSPYYSRRHRRRWDYSWAGSPSGAAAAAEPSTIPAGADENVVDGFALFGGYTRRIVSQQFKGGHLEAIFGGVELDLRRADIAGDNATLDATVVFGGCEICVPSRWIVEMHGQPLLGGYDDQTHQDVPQPGAKRLIITGAAIFGGVVIKN